VAVGVVGAVAAVLIHNSQRVAALPSTSIVFVKADIKQVRQAGSQVSREKGCRPPGPGDFEIVHEIIKDQKGPNGKVPYEKLLEAWREVLCRR
jgi:hypothetical protein